MRFTANRKRGSLDAAGAATLVAIIGALIVVYVLFLPPAVREALLAGNSTDDNSTNSICYNNTLIDEVPGQLYYSPISSYDHTLPSVTLVRETNSKVLAQINPFIVSNNWFDKKTAKFTFGVADLGNTDNVKLAFNAPMHDGTLSIWLNGNLVYEQETSSQALPISIPKAALANSNTLEFAVSGVGMAFWRTNRYSIDTLQIVGDVTDLSRQESSSIVILKDVERSNLDTATLKFIPECKDSDVGVLDVMVNNVPVFSAVPACGVRNSINVPKGVFADQQNTVSFKTNKGSYAVDQILLTTGLKKDPLLVYYFNLNADQYNRVQNGTKVARLGVTLVRTDEVKQANFIVNGYITSMWTRGYQFDRVIDRSWFVNGSNYMRLDPQTDLQIAHLTLILQNS